MSRRVRILRPRRFERSRPAFNLSTAEYAMRLQPTWRQRTLWVVPALEVAVVLLLIVALARPRSGVTAHSLQTEGVAIQLVIDRSGSMDHDDFQLHGKSATRLEAVKDVARRFLLGDDGLSGRPGDLVGVVSFAGEAERTSPLTLDHEFVVARLGETEPLTDFRADGTAIGDALALAVAQLNQYDQNRPASARSKPLKKVVVLLTDGEQNAGNLQPIEAARLAQAVGVKVYVIAIRPPGEDRGSVSEGLESLRQVASLTGGQFDWASSTEALARIHGRIDRLEKADLQETGYSDGREWAIESFQLGPFGIPPLALAAFLLLGAKVLLGRTLYRTIP